MNSPNAGQYPCPGGGYLGLGCANGQCATPGAGGAATFPGFAYPGLATGTTPAGASTVGAATPTPNAVSTSPGGLAPDGKVEPASASTLPPVRSLTPTGTPLALPSGRDPENRPVLPPPSNGGSE